MPGTIDNVAFFAGAARNLEGKAAGEYSGDHTSYVRREAIGVVGSVAPWNYPLQMAAWKVLPAIAAGNTIVLKPAELTPLTSLMLAEAAAEAGIPDGVVNVVTGTGRVAGEALMGHPDVDMVSFTGSSAVGRRVMELAAASANGPKRVHLELGGKAPFLVFDDADLDAAVQGAVAGALINTGQDCTAATRAYVQRPLYDAFVAGVADLMGTVVLGDPLDGRTDQGPLVSRAQQERVAGFVDRARRDGAKVVRGGVVPGGALARGAYYEPTLVVDAAQGVGDRPGRGVRPGARRAALRQRRRGPRAGQRHALRPGGVGLDPRRVPVAARHPRDQGRMRLDQRPHPDHQRDAARRLQVLGERQGHVHVLARGVHEHQARDVRRHGSGPQGLAPHRLHRHRTDPRPPAEEQTPMSHRRRPQSDLQPGPDVPRARARPALPALGAARRRRRRRRRRARRVRHRRHDRHRPTSRQPTVKDKSATDKVVRWANWPAYLDYDEKTKKYPTLEKFQQQTGIKATYAEDIDDNDSYYGKMQGQLKNGDDIGKDVIALTDWMAGRLIRQGYVQKLDKANIPNAKNLNPKLQDVDFDPGRNHSLTWQSGYAGIGYRKDKVGRELKTLDDLWAPDLKGKIVVLSEMRDTVGLIMMSQGVDISKDVHRGPVQHGARRAAEAGRLRPDPPGQGQLLPRGPAQRQRDRRDRLVRRHPARPASRRTTPTTSSRSRRPAARCGRTT